MNDIAILLHAEDESKQLPEKRQSLKDKAYSVGSRNSQISIWGNVSIQGEIDGRSGKPNNVIDHTAQDKFGK